MKSTEIVKKKRLKSKSISLRKALKKHKTSKFLTFFDFKF